MPSAQAAQATRSIAGRPRASLRALHPDTERAAFAVATLLASRLIVWVGGMWAIALFGINPAINAAMDFAHVTTPFSAHWANLVFAPTMRWDSVWYLHVAQAGYDSRQATAFFPLLPLLLRGGAMLLGSAVVAGALISLAAMSAGGWWLYRLARLDLGPDAAGLTVALIAVFPTSLFFSAIYTESLFLALSVGALYAGRRERWALAAALGALASASRATGVLLLVPLLVLWLYGPRANGVPGRPAPAWLAARPRLGALWPRYAPRPALAWLALVPAGLLAYCAYLAAKLGAPLAPFTAEHIWGRKFAGPFGGVLQALEHAPAALAHVLQHRQRPFGLGSPLGWDAYQLIDLPFLAFAAGGLWLGARRLPVAYTAYALLLCAQALSYPTKVEPMESFARYVLVIFPVFMGWAAWLVDRPRARALALGGLTAGLVAFSALWAITVWIA